MLEQDGGSPRGHTEYHAYSHTQLNPWPQVVRCRVRTDLICSVQHALPSHAAHCYKTVQVECTPVCGNVAPSLSDGMHVGSTSTFVTFVPGGCTQVMSNWDLTDSTHTM